MARRVSHHRLRSLDAFRGLTIALMILVNMPGSWSYVYAPLQHAVWFGWTPTDLVFPFFLFIVGVSLVFSLTTRRAEGTSSALLYRHILLRSAVLFGLGVLLNAYPLFALSTLRLTGVLQRIAVSYLFAAIVVLKTPIRWQGWLTAALLLGYWGLLAWIPVPGVATGTLTPEGNLAGWLDRAILGTHGYAHSPTDPEGLLSTLPAFATVLTGVLTGHWLQSGHDRRDILAWLYVAGWVTLLAGLWWSVWLPISKKLWTSSYVLFTTGAALHLLALCYWAIDIQGWQRWAQPAVIFGRNAITAYVGHILVIRTLLQALSYTTTDGVSANAYTWLYEHLFTVWAGPWLGSLAFAIANVLFWLGVLAVLYQRRLFIKI
jgi:predicted acyltransferase